MSTHEQFNIRCRGLLLLNGKLLVVKHSEQARHYALPGGHLEPGENPLECLKREIKEELGIEIKNAELKYVYRWVNPEDTVTNIEFIFLVNDEVSPTIDITNTSHAFEIFDIQWIDKTSDILVKPTFVYNEFITNSVNFEGVKFI